MARRQRIVGELLDAHYPALLAYTETICGTDRAQGLLDKALVGSLAWPHHVPTVDAAGRTVRIAIARQALHMDAPDPAGPSTEQHDTLAAIAALPPKGRVAVVLRHHEGLSVGEIAAVMRTSTSKAARSLEQAESALCAALDVDVGEVGEQAQVLAGGRGR